MLLPRQTQIRPLPYNTICAPFIWSPAMQIGFDLFPNWMNERFYGGDVGFKWVTWPGSFRMLNETHDSPLSCLQLTQPLAPKALTPTCPHSYPLIHTLSYTRICTHTHSSSFTQSSCVERPPRASVVLYCLIWLALGSNNTLAHSHTPHRHTCFLNAENVPP